MKKSVLISAVLWIVALGLVAYLFKGQETMPLAVVLLGILGFVDVITTQTFSKGE